MTINNLGPNFGYGFNQTPKNKKEQVVRRKVEPENVDIVKRDLGLSDAFKLRFDIPLS